MIFELYYLEKSGFFCKINFGKLSGDNKIIFFSITHMKFILI